MSVESQINKEKGGGLMKMIIWIIIIYLIIGAVIYFLTGSKDINDIFTWPQDYLSKFTGKK